MAAGSVRTFQRPADDVSIYMYMASDRKKVSLSVIERVFIPWLGTLISMSKKI